MMAGSYRPVFAGRDPQCPTTQHARQKNSRTQFKHFWMSSAECGGWRPRRPRPPARARDASFRHRCGRRSRSRREHGAIRDVKKRELAIVGEIAKMVELGIENQAKPATLDERMTRSVRVVAGGLATSVVCTSPKLERDCRSPLASGERLQEGRPGHGVPVTVIRFP